MMWEIGRNSTQMASLHAMMHGIHVLLVDHETEDLINTAKQLEMCQYKVTFIEHASAAIAMLPSGKAKFDVVMANINSPDLHGLKLLQHAVYMCIPVVLLSNDDDAFMAMRALEHGAFLYLKKPLPMEFLRCLWQHVVREKTRMVREREMYIASNNVGPVRGIEFREVVRPREENPTPTPHIPIANLNPNPNPNPNPNMMMKNKGKGKAKIRGRYDDYGEEYDSESHKPGNVRRKMCTEWTHELHAKFMNAVEQLGEGRCFPKEILEMMNEPGLTRMQVASHLQKCRNDNWRAPEERKPSHHTMHQATSSGSGSQSIKPRRFGSKPLVNRHFPGQSSESLSETQTPTIGAKLEIGSMMAHNTPHHYGTNASLNTRRTPDEYFNFLNVDCLTRNFSGGQQQNDTNNPGRAYNNEQNSGETSSQTKSLWSSDTSNLDSDHSETKAQLH